MLNFTVPIHITAQKHCPGGIRSEVDLKQIKQPDVAVLIRQILAELEIAVGHWPFSD